MALATIVLEMFKSGIHLTCDETGHDEFIKHGDGNTLMKILNDIEDLTDPDAVITLTEKGKLVLKLHDENGLSYDEAMAIADDKYKTNETEKGETKDE